MVRSIYRDGTEILLLSDVKHFLTISMLFASIRLNVEFWERNAVYSVLGWVLKTAGDAKGEGEMSKSEMDMCYHGNQSLIRSVGCGWGG